MSEPKQNPKAKQLIDEYINKTAPFAQPICKKLRTIIFKAEPNMIEDWKWGPNYQKSGMVCGYGAFKEHVTLAFFQGAMLKDPKKILTDGSANQHNRSLKFKSVDDIPEKILIAYIKEAVKNNEKGIKSEIKSVVIPPDLKKALQKANVLEKFQATNFTNRREYVQWVKTAKRKETRASRIERTVERITKGIKFS